MTDPAQVEAAFRADLIALLARYDTSIDIEDLSLGYEGSHVRMVVYIPNRWDEFGKLTQAGAEVDLGGRSFP